MKDISSVIAFIRDTLHIDVAPGSKALNYAKPLPLAVKSRYEIFPVKLEGRESVLLAGDEEDIRSIKKQLHLFETSLSLPVILYLENTGASTRRYLIENGIPFVSEEAIYLPQLLVYLNGFKEKYKKVKNEKLSKLTQTILIELILNRRRSVTIGESAEAFGVTKMSASRALNELSAFGYLDAEHRGRTKVYRLKRHIETEKLFGDLKDPVMETLYIKEQDLHYFEKRAKASYSALSHYADIMDNAPVYAVEKEYFNTILQQNDAVFIYDRAYDENLVRIELWRYRPQLTGDDVVDPISLYLSLKEKTDIYDSRVNDAMRELYDQIEGYIS